MVFLEKKNITKWKYLQQAAKECGLDTQKLSADYKGRAVQLFQDDLALSRQWGVRGFPTIFFVDSAGNKQMVYGSGSYAAMEAAVLKIIPGAGKKSSAKEWQALFQIYPSLTRKEFAALSGMTPAESERLLNRLEAEGKLEATTTKNGKMWKR